MIAAILAVLLVFALQTLIGPVVHYLGTPGERVARLGIALGPRDAPPPRPVLAGRADRALRNMFEALPVFLTLALLSVLLRVDAGLATGGAWLFLVARVLYVPAYLWGPPGLRTLVWLGGVAGILMIATAVASTLG